MRWVDWKNKQNEMEKDKIYFPYNCDDILMSIFDNFDENFSVNLTKPTWGVINSAL